MARCAVGLGVSSRDVVWWWWRRLLEEGAVEELRVAGGALAFQAVEQVPEVDTSDALTGELPGRSRARSGRGRGGLKEKEREM